MNVTIQNYYMDTSRNLRSHDMNTICEIYEHTGLTKIMLNTDGKKTKGRILEKQDLGLNCMGGWISNMRPLLKNENKILAKTCDVQKTAGNNKLQFSFLVI